MAKLKMTDDVKMALYLQGQAVAMALEDEGLALNVRRRIAARANATMRDVIDPEYEHIATVAVN